jgi:hypothetical protein
MAVINPGYNPGMNPYQNPYMYSYQPVQQTQPSQQSNNSITWVQGEAGAKSYLVAPNTTVQLWDSENQVIYLKSADASGMPSMKVLDYTIRSNAPAAAPAVAQQPSVDMGQYVTKAELEALYGQISGLKTKIEKLSQKEAANE